MATRHPDRDIVGRSLLGLLAAGFTSIGLFILVMEYPEPRPEGGPVTLLVIPGLGVLGLIGAGVGRAFGRWVLAGFGVVLIGGAVELVVGSYGGSGSGPLGRGGLLHDDSARPPRPGVGDQVAPRASP